MLQCDKAYVTALPMRVQARKVKGLGWGICEMEGFSLAFGFREPRKFRAQSAQYGRAWLCQQCRSSSQ